MGEEKTKRIELAQRDVVDRDEADGKAGRQVALEGAESNSQLGKWR